MGTGVNPSQIAELCEHLRPIYEDELAAGNVVQYTEKGAGHADAIAVMFRNPFQTSAKDLPAGVVFREVNDPHWWKAEYTCPTHHHMVACLFG